MQLSYIERHIPASSPDPENPVLILIHGRGDSPQNFIHLSDGLNTPRRELALCGTQELNFGFDRGWQWFESSASEGNSPALVEEINAATRLIAKDLEALNQSEGRPERRFVISGFSQGGILTYALALNYPKLVSHALPIAGLLPAGCRPKLESIESIQSMPPIWAFHGLADPLVSAERAQELIGSLKAQGYPQTFSGYPGVEHSVSPEMHRDYLAALDKALRAN